MELKPSDIFYSQNSINNTFREDCEHKDQLIGETLDEICEGRTSINEIPNIRVVNMNGKWVTCDNRRLWIFRHAEKLGKCDKIPVKEWSRIPNEKLTSFNGGCAIRVRGRPGGSRLYKLSKRRDSPTPKSSSNIRRFYDSKIPSALLLNNKAVSSVTSTPSYITNVQHTTMLHNKTEVSISSSIRLTSPREPLTKKCNYGPFSFGNNNDTLQSVASSMLKINNHAQQAEPFQDQHNATNPRPEAEPEPPQRRRSKRFRKTPDRYGQDQHNATNPRPEAEPEPPPRRRSKRFRQPPDRYGQWI